MNFENDPEWESISDALMTGSGLGISSLAESDELVSTLVTDKQLEDAFDFAVGSTQTEKVVRKPSAVWERSYNFKHVLGVSLASMAVGVAALFGSYWHLQVLASEAAIQEAQNMSRRAAYEPAAAALNASKSEATDAFRQEELIAALSQVCLTSTSFDADSIELIACSADGILFEWSRDDESPLLFERKTSNVKQVSLVSDQTSAIKRGIAKGGKGIAKRVFASTNGSRIVVDGGVKEPTVEQLMAEKKRLNLEIARLNILLWLCNPPKAVGD